MGDSIRNRLIYVEDAIDALLNTEHTMFDTDGYVWVNRNEVKLRIEELPSAEPQKGKWIDTGSGQECSKCHEIQPGYDNFRYFCAFCGSYNEDDAEMREGGEE